MILSDDRSDQSPLTRTGATTLGEVLVNHEERIAGLERATLNLVGAYQSLSKIVSPPRTPPPPDSPAPSRHLRLVGPDESPTPAEAPVGPRPRAPFVPRLV